MVRIANRIQIPFSFNYPSGGNLVPAANVSVGVYVRNNDGSQGSPASVFQSQAGSSQYSSLLTDAGGNVPGWVNEGTYKIVAAASGSFGGGTINFDALYGGGTALIGTGAVGPSQIQPNSIDIAQLSTGVAQSLIAPGVILDFAGAAPPAGFLSCNGGIASQSNYPNLWSAIGATWNIGGEGAGNFRLPNLMGRVSVGAGGGAGLTTRLLAQMSGEETHNLLAGETPLVSHTHTFAAAYSGSGTTSSNGFDHSHVTTVGIQNQASVCLWQGGFGAWTTVGVGATGYGSGFANANHTHTYSWGGSISGVTNGSSISGTPHNNLQPYTVVNKIIKY